MQQEERRHLTGTVSSVVGDSPIGRRNEDTTNVYGKLGGMAKAEMYLWRGWMDLEIEKWWGIGESKQAKKKILCVFPLRPHKNDWQNRQ